MKLRFYTNKKGQKLYTLKDETKQSEHSSNSEETKPAHYKFIKVRDAPKNKN